MDVLVCGGAGYIGSSLAQKLVGRGDRVVVFDNLVTGFRSAADNSSIKFIEGNLLNERDLYLLFKQFKFNAVYHLASRSPYTTNQPNAELCYRNNITGTMNLLSAMRSNDVKNIVFASTAAVYGHENGNALSETQVVNPVGEFASTNTTVEQMLGHFNREYGVNSVSLRFSNASGVDSLGSHSGLYQRNNSDLYAVLKACQVVSKSEYKILGDEHPTADGTVEKEYLHVLDVCDAHIKAMDYLLRDNNGAHIYNLGDERAYSARELVALAENVTGKRVITTVENPEDGPSTQTLSSARAKQDLNWKPEYNVEEIMKTLWQVMQQPTPDQIPVAEDHAIAAEISGYELMKPEPGALDRVKSWYQMTLGAKLVEAKSKSGN